MEAAVCGGTEFDFELREGSIWVQVTIPEAPYALNFLLDSGAETSVIDLSRAKALKLALRAKVAVKGVHSSADAYWCETRAAKAGGVTVPNRFLAVDLRELSGSCERPVDGLIGLDFFRGRRAEIDFGESKARILPRVVRENDDMSIPLDVRRCGMRVKACVNGRRADWFRVDTGCASALQWVTGSVDPDACLSKVAIGLTELRIPQTRTTVCLGTEVFRDVETGLHTKAIFPGEIGLIGLGLLSQFTKVTFDAPGGTLVLGRRSSRAAPGAQ
jgi:hypothetical protein